MSILPSEKQASETTLKPLSTRLPGEEAKSAKGIPPAAELGLWLYALRSFFQTSNHPFTEANQALNLLSRDWSHELHIARKVMLRCSQLALLFLKSESDAGALLESIESNSLLNISTPADLHITGSINDASDSLAKLAEALQDACAICEGLIKAPAVSFHSWISLGKFLARELEHSSVVIGLAKAAVHQSDSQSPLRLLTIARERVAPDKLGADMIHIFSTMVRILERLDFIGNFLTKDQPLKQMLPIFTLIHGEARELSEFIETRALHLDGLDGNIFEALDGINYAIAMELRKVFSHELVGLSELRQAPVIYSRVEASHGLLRECFQQSTITLAKFFDPTLDGTRLFDTFRLKLKNSLALRADLWLLLKLVRQVEHERDMSLIPTLLERLREFEGGSKLYLMYKDWDACERFIEEVEASRTILELAPILHRFGAFLETLYGQVNMRAVLVNHPFDSMTSDG